MFVAGDAFALNENMLKPFIGSKLTVNQGIFNYRLSRARRIIENTFGILSSKWRIFNLENTNTNPTTKAKHIRMKFADYFAGTGAVAWQNDRI